MSEFDSPDDLRMAELLGGLDQRIRPSADETARARARLEADLDEMLGSLRTSPDLDRRELQGLTELPRLIATDEAPRSRPRLLLAAAAAVVLLCVGIVALRSFDGGSELEIEPSDTTTTTTSPSTTTAVPTVGAEGIPLTASDVGSTLTAGRYAATVGGRPVSFEVTDDTMVVAVTDAYLTFEPLESVAPGIEQVDLIAAPDLFDGGDPEEWIAALGASGNAFGRVTDGAGRQEWTVSVLVDGCESFAPCPPLSPTVPEVGVSAGGQTRVLAIVDDGVAPAALLSNYRNLPQDGAVFELYNLMAETIDFADN